MKQQFFRLLILAIFTVASLGIIMPESVSLQQPPAAEAQTITWSGTYFSNINLTGSGISVGPYSSGTSGWSQNWGDASPVPPGLGQPTDIWSLRVTSSQITLTPGNYRFSVSAEDGARMTITQNGVPTQVINDSQWGTDRTMPFQATADYQVNGPITITLEMYNSFGPASLGVLWLLAPVDPWTVTYYDCVTPPGSLPTTACTNQIGTTESVATTAIQKNWDMAAVPGSAQTDNWSSLWTKTVELPVGPVQFRVQADDTFTLYVDGSAILQSEPLFIEGRIYETTYNVAAAGDHVIQVAHSDFVRQAYLYVVWNNNGTLPGDTGDGDDPLGETGVTATVTANVGLNIRSGPGTQYDKIGLAQNGSTFPVTGRLADNSWLRLNFNGQVGWGSAAWLSVTGDINSVPVVGADQIDPGDDGDGQPPPAGDIVMNARPVGNMRIRTGPGLNFDRIGFVPWGEVVGVFGQDTTRQWIKITYTTKEGNVLIGWSFKVWYREADNLFAQLPFDLPIVQ